MINDYFKFFLERLYLLLAPIREDCLTCSKRTSSLDRRYGICHKCCAAIPWIVSPRCLICGRGIGCPDCSRTSNEKRYFIANRSAVFYNGDMREWLAQYKYRGQERYAPLLIQMLDRAFELMINECRALESEDSKAVRGRIKNTQLLANTPPWNIDIITSVPVSGQRLVERGFNQAEVLGRGLARKRNIPYLNLLTRERHSDKQSFKSRVARMKDMNGIFELGPIANEVFEKLMGDDRYREGDVSGRDQPLRILMIDDIYTTGSTVNACSRVLCRLEPILQRPIEVFCLTWARS